MPGGAMLQNGALLPPPEIIEGKAARRQGRGQIVLALFFFALGGVIFWRMWRYDV